MAAITRSTAATYDADGKGGEDAVLLGKLDNHLALTEHDFLIV